MTARAKRAREMLQIIVLPVVSRDECGAQDSKFPVFLRPHCPEIVPGVSRLASQRRGAGVLGRAAAPAMHLPVTNACALAMLGAALLACTAPTPLPPASPPVARVLVQVNRTPAWKRCADYLRPEQDARVCWRVGQ